MKKRPLDLRIASPCEEAWDAMRPAGEGRHCSACHTTVVDLSSLTRTQAEATVRAHGGELCARVRIHAGEAVFRKERARLPVLAEVALAGLLAACAPEPGGSTAADDTEQRFDPDAPADAALDLTPTAGLGGSLASGVMMPMAPADAPPAAAPPAAVPAAAALVANGAFEPSGTPISPTVEQLALTRRKERRRQTLAQPPPQHRMGIMRCSIDDL